MSENQNSDHKSELNSHNTDHFSGRLKLAIGSESTNSFAKKCGIRESTIRGYLSGSIPSLDKAAILAKAAQVDLTWLATGAGQMRPKEGVAEENTLEDEFAMIPGYSIQVAAGTGSLPGSERPSRKLAFRRKWLRFRGLNEKDLVLVFAKGDSMEPTISDNNTVMIDTSQRELRDGCIYVIRTNDHLIVKRIQTRLGKQVLLLSDNSAYPPIEVNMDEPGDLEVIGRAVWIGKDV